MSSGVDRIGDVDVDMELNPFSIVLDKPKVAGSRPGDVPLPNTIPLVTSATNKHNTTLTNLTLFKLNY